MPRYPRLPRQLPKPPKPWQEKPVTIGCSVPRPLYDALLHVATTRDVTVSVVMRECIVKSLQGASDEPAREA